MTQPEVRRTFYQNQDDARAQTQKLLFVFFTVLLLVVGLTMVAVHAVLELGSTNPDARVLRELPPFPNRFDFMAGGAALAVILIGAWIKKAQLSRGGQVVAHMLGGRAVLPSSATPDEIKLLNVVEEMAIASGIAVPPVYVLDREPGINAFAAGLGISNAVIAVSKGAVENLSRDELQGVIAHEFSHIFNGDMKLHMDLMGWVGGLVGIATVGRFFFEVSGNDSRRNGGAWSGRRDRDSRDGQAVFLILGLALLVIGMFGRFMAELIKAAVSRQREFLADATAVQYTRNPMGIGGALLKIQRSPHQSTILTPRGKEASHFFFASALGRSLLNFATHPPIEERLKRISPDLLNSKHASVQETASSPVAPPVADGTASALTPRSAPLLTRQTTVETLARTSSTAPSLVIALLLLDDEATATSILQNLSLQSENSAWPARSLLDEVENQRKMLAAMPDEPRKRNRFTLLIQSLPALRLPAIEDRMKFLELCTQIVRMNGRVSIYEASALAILQKSLAPHAELKTLGRVEAQTVDSAVSILFSAMASLSSESEVSFACAERDLKKLGWTFRPPAADAVNGQSLLNSLRVLSGLNSRRKRDLVGALKATALADRLQSTEENELLKAVALALESPLESATLKTSF